MKKTIEINYLDNFLIEKFKCTGWIFKCKVLELVCYNPKTGIYVVIEDGCCYITGEGDDDFWPYNVYQFNDKNKGMEHMLSEYKHPKDTEAYFICDGQIKI